MTYRAAICTALDGPGAVHVGEREETPLQAGEVRVAVKAAGVNFPDLLMTYGKYQFRPEPPFVPGLEVSGVIAGIGAEVTGWSVGDRIMGGAKGGCFAESVVLPAASISALPAALSFEEGACWQAGASTAWHALYDKAALKPDETVLILGASGGVGSAAALLARELGATVIATASTADKRAVVSGLGAHHVLDPADPDLARTIKALTGERGVDAVFDPVGGDLALAATRAIGWGGRYLIVGFASGTVPSFPANHALIKGYSLIGLRAGEARRRDPALDARTRKALSEFAARGALKPHISHRFALEEAGAALRALEDRAVIGRAVIII